MSRKNMYIERKNKTIYLDKYIEDGFFVKEIKSKDRLFFECEKCGKKTNKKVINFKEKPPQLLCSSCKQEETNLTKYGTKSSAQSEKVKEKQKQTNQKRYGGNSPKHSKETIKKTEETNLRRFGVKYPSQNEDIKLKMKETNLEKFGTPYASQSKIIKDKYHKIYFNNLKSFKDDDIIPLFGLEEYKGSKKYYYPFKCKKCGLEFKGRIENGFIPSCPKCRENGTSFAEKEMADFISSYFDIERNKKFGNKELDIFIPSFDIGIEYNGFYWHSNIFKEKYFHMNKQNHFNKIGIRTITIFEDENYEDFLFNVLHCGNNINFKNNIIYNHNKEIGFDNLISRRLYLSLRNDALPPSLIYDNKYKVYDNGTLILTKN